jgi:hypothetical protein
LENIGTRDEKMRQIGGEKRKEKKKKKKLQKVEEGEEDGRCEIQDRGNEDTKEMKR